jgi:hypothetical protein
MDGGEASGRTTRDGVPIGTAADASDPYASPVMSEPISIRRAIERLLDGTIRIPGFQRRFVWEPQPAALLMDSL